MRRNRYHQTGIVTKMPLPSGAWIPKYRWTLSVELPVFDHDRYDESASRMRASAKTCPTPELREQYLRIATTY